PSPRLTEDLRRLYGPAVHVPLGVDREVLRAARRGLRRSVTRVFLIRWAAGTAAAAALLTAAILTWKPGHHVGAGPARVLARADLDGSGRVDILDAFMLARTLHDHQ